MLNLDLNLLRTFDALMEHRSVTKAAASLSVTQSAVSHALARLRTTLDDPVFVRGAGVLQPTALAEAIAGGVRRGLGEFQEALASTNFDPARADRSFTVAASTYFCTDLVPALIETLRREAPGVSLRLVPVTDMLMPMIDRGEVDLALGATIETPVRFVVEPLYEERFVWVAAADNPIARRKVTAAQIKRVARISVVATGPFSAASQVIDTLPVEPGDWESPIGLRNGIAVYDSQTAIAIAARSDLIARVPERIAARAAERGDVAILDTAADRTGAGIAMVWHSRQRSAQDLAWLRATIRQIAG